jgi:hypothetical protein
VLLVLFICLLWENNIPSSGSLFITVPTTGYRTRMGCTLMFLPMLKLEHKLCSVRIKLTGISSMTGILAVTSNLIEFVTISTTDIALYNQDQSCN